VRKDGRSAESAGRLASVLRDSGMAAPLWKAPARGSIIRLPGEVNPPLAGQEPRCVVAGVAAAMLARTDGDA
jgi:hypothetical protein